MRFNPLYRRLIFLIFDYLIVVSTIILSYWIVNQNILNNKVEKKVNYNNINDKFELTKYEDNLIKNLSINISEEILTAVKSINK